MKGVIFISSLLCFENQVNYQVNYKHYYKNNEFVEKVHDFSEANYPAKVASCVSCLDNEVIAIHIIKEN